MAIGVNVASVDSVVGSPAGLINLYRRATAIHLLRLQLLLFRGTSAPPAPPPWPRRIIDHSARMDRAEEELRCALSMLVVGDISAVPVDGLAAELARRYDLPAALMTIHRPRPSELLLVFSTEEDGVRVYNDGRPIQLPQVMLHCRCWSRLRNATSVTLPHLVDIEIRGVPTHVWELETAEHLLDEWCWIHALHPDTVERRDYCVSTVSLVFSP